MTTWSYLPGEDSFRRGRGPLRTERAKDGRRVLLRELVLDVHGLIITVPAGFVTDYSSVPGVLAGVVHWSRIDLAGVAHDWLYVTGQLDGRPVTRAFADAMWREIALSGDHHANVFQAWGGWLVLRIGGWYVWGGYRRGTRPHPPGEVVLDPTCCGRPG